MLTLSTVPQTERAEDRVTGDKVRSCFRSIAADKVSPLRPKSARLRADEHHALRATLPSSTSRASSSPRQPCASFRTTCPRPSPQAKSSLTAQPMRRDGRPSTTRRSSTTFSNDPFEPSDSAFTDTLPSIFSLVWSLDALRIRWFAQSDAKVDWRRREARRVTAQSTSRT